MYFIKCRLQIPSAGYCIELIARADWKVLASVNSCLKLGKRQCFESTRFRIFNVADDHNGEVLAIDVGMPQKQCADYA